MPPQTPPPPPRTLAELPRPAAAPVQIPTRAGCPNRAAATELVERVAHTLGVEPRLELVEVADAEPATRLRFLGSPSIPHGGHDVEPGVEQRTGYRPARRLYRTATAVQGTPAEASVRSALLAQARQTE